MEWRRWDHWGGLAGGDDFSNATIIVDAVNERMSASDDRQQAILDWRYIVTWMTGEDSSGSAAPRAREYAARMDRLDA
jgi:putative SOS response-associated peptidase YedK